MLKELSLGSLGFPKKMTIGFIYFGFFPQGQEPKP